MIAVISAPVMMSDFVTNNTGGAILDVISSSTRTYVLHRVSQRDTDQTFSDPIDGMVLIELRYFKDEVPARAWITAAIARAA